MTRRDLAIGAALVAIGFSAWWYLQPSKAETTEASSPSDTGQSKRGKGGGAGGAAVAVTTDTAVKVDFPIKKRAIGWVETPASVLVRPRLDSQIATQAVVDGQMVKKGDLLFELDDREQQAQLAKDQAQLAKDQALHQRIERDLARSSSLLAKGAATQQAVDQGTSDLKSADASIRSDQAAIQSSQLKLSYTKIYAPIDGRVGAITLTPGNLVNANSTTGLVTITQVDPVRVTFTMPERELTAIRAAVAAGKPPEVHVIPTGAKTATAQGTLNFFDSNVDIMSGTVTLKAPIRNADLALWPGQYVDIELFYEPLHDMMVVPTVAVESGQDSPFVYLVKPDNTIELRKVAVAASEGAKTAIASGLAAGERVVVDGQGGLTNGSRVRDATQRADADARPFAASPATN